MKILLITSILMIFCINMRRIIGFQGINMIKRRNINKIINYQQLSTHISMKKQHQQKSYRYYASSSSSSLSSSSSSSNINPNEMIDLLNEIRDVILATGVQTSVRRGIQAAQAITELSLEYAQNPNKFAVDDDDTKKDNNDISATSINISNLNINISIPKVLKALFEKLGATYVKLGQFIASSPTLFPKEYVREFQGCLDQSSTFPYSDIRKIIQNELGSDRPISSVFSYIDPVPIASASIAQVHRARLRDKDAPIRDVVLKVRKPNVEDVLKSDLGFLYITSKLLEIINPSLTRLSLSSIVGDIRMSMLEELDFNLEANNLISFKEFLKNKNLENVATAPTPILEATNTMLLTMEYLDGVPLSDLDSIQSTVDDPEKTLMSALGTWASTVAEHESFHADVHAGNLLVLNDGRIGFIDFGIVGRISDQVWNALAGLTQGVVNNNYQLMAQSLADMGATNENTDIDAFALGLEDVFTKIFTLEPQIAVTVASDLDGSVNAASASLSIDENEITELVLSLVDVSEKNGLKLPREFGLLMKQALYFDRYQKILAPESDPLRDPRLKDSLSDSSFQQGLRPSLNGGTSVNQEQVIDVTATPIE